MDVRMSWVAHKIGTQVEADGGTRRSVVVKSATQIEDEARGGFVPVVSKAQACIITNESRPSLRVQPPRTGGVTDLYAKQTLLCTSRFAGNKIELRAEVDEARQMVCQAEARAWIESGAPGASFRNRWKMESNCVKIELPSWLVFPCRPAFDLCC